MSADRQGGLTLIELIVFIVIVSVGLAGILSVLNVAVRGSADPLAPKQALLIAEALLEEATGKSFADPGGGAEGGRADWDNVDDYSGFAMPGAGCASGICDITGTPVAGLESYTAAVTVAPPAAPIGGVPPAQIRAVTVTVTDAAGQTYALTGYRFNND